MELSNLQPAAGSKHSDNFRRGRAMVQAMVRPLVRAIRVRRLVLEHQDQALKVDRCHYTDVCQSVDSPI